MFTIIEGKIYQIDEKEKELKEIKFIDGQIKVNKKGISYDTLDSVYTITEIKNQFASEFEEIEPTEEEDLEEELVEEQENQEEESSEEEVDEKPIAEEK